jgi:hypothetical protein
LLQNVKSIQNRKHHVQQNQVVATFQRPGQAARAGLHGIHVEIVGRQELGHQFAKADIVVDDENRTTWFG